MFNIRPEIRLIGI
uniref:Uncharacterized protein n=1 Tax=Romanomermis culicivorax TaxID=13658 RepID=A0A915L6V2_ROMCU